MRHISDGSLPEIEVLTASNKLKFVIILTSVGIEPNSCMLFKKASCSSLPSFPGLLGSGPCMGLFKKSAASNLESKPILVSKTHDRALLDANKYSKSCHFSIPDGTLPLRLLFDRSKEDSFVALVRSLGTNPFKAFVLLDKCAESTNTDDL